MYHVNTRSDVIDKISIIVPIYNVEKYLRKCIDSILAQTFKNIEVILVDDGSPDESPMICDEYAKRDDRIVVIHKPNGGLSSARNAGISVATGNFIGFVDSDDYIHPDMYKILHEKLVRNDAQIAECTVTTVYGEIQKNISGTGMIQSYSGEEALELLMFPEKNKLNPRFAVWSKLFRADIIGDLLFPLGMIHEDHLYDAQAFLRANRYVIVDKPLYFHNVRENSITTVKFGKKDYAKLLLINERTSFLRNNGHHRLADLSKMQYYIMGLLFYDLSVEAGLQVDAQNLLKEIRGNIKEINKMNLSLKRKIDFRLFRVSPSLYLSYSRVRRAINKVIR
jgi:glycosyltransferase involved in cell wall biosynthesis